MLYRFIDEGAEVKNKSKVLLLAAFLTVGFITSASAQWSVQNSDTTSTSLGSIIVDSDDNDIFSGDFDGNLFRFGENLTVETSTSFSYDFNNNPTFYVVTDTIGHVAYSSDKYIEFDHSTNQINSYSIPPNGEGISSGTAATFSTSNDRLYYVGLDSNFDKFLRYYDISSDSVTQIEDLSDDTGMEYANGKVYYTDNGNLKVYDESSASTNILSSSILSDGAYSSVVEYKNGAVYVGDRSALNKYDTSDGSYSTINSFSRSTGRISSIAYSDSQQFLAVSDGSNGLEVYDTAQSNSKVYEKSTDSNIKDLKFKGNEYLYVTDNGIDQVQTSGVIKPPSVSINEPQDGETKTLDYGESTKSFSYNFTVNTEGLDTNYTILVNGSEYDSGTESAAAEPVYVTGSVNAPLGDTSFSATVESDGGTDSSGTNTVTVNDKEKPTLKLTKPENQTAFDITGDTRSTELSGYVEGSKETGTAYIRTVLAEGTIREQTYQTDVGSVSVDQNQSFSNTFDLQTTYDDINGDPVPAFYRSSEIYVDYGTTTFSSDEIRFDFQEARPVITNFSTNPNIGNAEPGDQFDLSIEGDVNNASIDRIEYDQFVGNSKVDEVTVNDLDFQDNDQFTDDLANAFDFKEQWEGSKITIAADVYDLNGLSDSVQLSAQTATPPDDFLLNSPDDGTVFLISDSETETQVDIEWGIDTAEYGGTAELLVNGNVQDSFTIGNQSQNTVTYADNYTENNYNWKVRFNDSKGNTYESGSKSFEVTDEPVSLVLNEPSTGSEFNIAGRNSVSVDHGFDIDSRAMGSQNHYYVFNLTDSQNNEVVSRTSGTFSSGQQSHVESASLTETGNYNWEVSVYRSSDDLLLEQKSDTYDVVSKKVFNVSLNSPSDGSSFSLGENQTSRDVDVSYNIETFNDSVTTDILKNGTKVGQINTASSTSTTEQFTLSDLTEGTYNLKLEAEDTGGQVKTRESTFSVDAYDPQDPVIDQMEFRPSINEADVGETMDLYIHGQGDPDDVAGVEVVVNTGAGEETFTIPSEDLQETGSYEYTITGAVTKTQEMEGESFSILGKVTDTLGNVWETLVSGNVDEPELSVFTERPVNNNAVFQPEGQADPVQFTFTANTLENEVNWELLAKHESQNSYTLVATEAEQDEQPLPAGESGYEYTTAVNLSDTLGESRGSFKWKLFVEDTQDASLTAESTSADFRVLNEGTTALNIDQPESKEYPVDNSGEATIPISGEVRTNTEGLLEIDIIDNDPESTPLRAYEEAISGDEKFSDSEQLDKGTYNFQARYTDNQGNLTEESFTFSVVEQETSTNESSIEFSDETTARNRLYKNFDNTFGWTVVGADESGNTTLYIQQEQGDGSWQDVEAVDYEYDTQNEPVPYRYDWGTDVSVGDYRAYAEAELETQTISTDNYEFDVVDFRKPEVTIIEPNGTSYKENETVSLEFEAETFEDDIQGTIFVRGAGSVSGTQVGSFTQDASSVQEYTEEITRTPGQYEWFVKSDINPESSSSAGQYNSEVGSFTVKPESISEPNISLENPEQDDVFEYNENESGYNLTYRFSSQVYSDSDANVSLRTERVESGEGQGYKTVGSFLQNAEDDNVSRTVERTLEEAGYRYKVRVKYPNGQTFESSPVSFAVDYLETAESPDVPRPEDSPSFLDRGVNFLVGLTGPQGTMFLAVVLTLAASVAVTIKAESDKLGMATMVLVSLGFTSIGWFPSWIAVTFVLIAVGITVFVTNKLLNAGGGG